VFYDILTQTRKIPSSFTETIFELMGTPQTALTSLPVWGLEFLCKINVQ